MHTCGFLVRRFNFIRLMLVGIKTDGEDDYYKTTWILEVKQASIELFWVINRCGIPWDSDECLVNILCYLSIYDFWCSRTFMLEILRRKYLSFEFTRTLLGKVLVILVYSFDGESAKLTIISIIALLIILACYLKLIVPK